MVASDYDVCPFRADNQSDTGGFESPSNPDGANANGIGNACECGEVFRDDGRAKIEDTDVIQSFLVEDVPPGTSLERFSTAGGPDCGPEDWVATWQVHNGGAPGVEASCPPALP